MKRFLSVMVVGLLLFAYGCGGSDDPKVVMDEFVTAFENYIGDIEKSESADDVVTAVEKFTDKVNGMADRIKKVKEKYPDLGKPGAKLPEEFKDIEKRMEAMMPKMMQLGQKIAQYATDPKVMEAQKKFMEAMKVIQ